MKRQKRNSYPKKEVESHKGSSGSFAVTEKNNSSTKSRRDISSTGKYSGKKRKRDSDNRTHVDMPHPAKEYKFYKPYSVERKRESSDDDRPPRKKRRFRKNHGYRGRFFSRPQEHTCTIKKKYLQSITAGEKTYEGRVNTKMFQEYKEGDRVKWFCGNNQVITEITERKEFKSFEEMLQGIDFRKMVPEARTLNYAVNLYKNIPGYTEKAERFGVVALGLRVCAPQVQQDVESNITEKLSMNAKM